MPISVTIAVAGAVAGQAAAAYIGTHVMLSALSLKVIGAVVGAVVSGAASSAIGGRGGGTPAATISSQGRTVTVRQPISSWQTIYGRTRVPGVITFIESTNSNQLLHLVITYAGHVSDEIEDIYVNDELLELNGDGSGAGKWAQTVNALGQLTVGPRAWIIRSLGDEAGQPFAMLQSLSASKWTAEHRQAGRTKIYARLQWGPKIYANGVPNITAVIRGKTVYDPRSGLTAWSDNPALCLADYLMDASVGMGHAAAEIDMTLLAAAANVCEESVSLADGSTQARYTCNGVVTADMSPNDVMPELLSSMAGRAVFIGGKWRIYAGAYITPTVTLTEDDFRGPVRVQTMLSRRDTFNAVKGVFVSPDNNWVPTDFPPVTNAAYEAQDNDERIWEEMRLPFTDSSQAAQRLAKAALEQTRQAITVSAPLKLSAWRVAPPQTVMLTLPRMGWSAKIFEVLEARLVAEDADGGVVMGVDLVLRETAAAVWDWTTDDEQALDPAPNTNLPNPFDVAPPGSPSVVETLYETTGSVGVRSRATVSWSASEDQFTALYQLEYKAVADTAYTILPRTSDTTYILDDLAPGRYHMRVSAINSIGVQSDYSSPSLVEIYGLREPPAAVAGFSVIASAGFALAQWTLHTDLDVRIGGQIIVRHSQLTSGATWADGVTVGAFPGGLVQGLVPLVTGTYMAKALDSSGAWSASAVTFTLTEGMVTGLSVIGSLTEDPGFSGTKTSCVVDSGHLELSGSTQWDSISGTLDDYADIDSAGGQATSGTYEFGALDLTTVAVRRFEADIGVTAVDNTDTVDSRVSSVDDWDSIDGTAVNDCDATLYAAITDDDPAGTPTWSSWRAFVVADFNCRAAKFRLDLTAGSAEHNIQVDTLRVAAKA